MIAPLSAVAAVSDVTSEDFLSKLRSQPELLHGLAKPR